MPPNFLPPGEDPRAVRKCSLCLPPPIVRTLGTLAATIHVKAVTPASPMSPVETHGFYNGKPLKIVTKKANQAQCRPVVWFKAV